MKTKKRSLALIMGSASLLTLGACGIPNSIPTGYTYHRDTYKSATPEPSPRVTTTQRQYMDATQAEQFRDAVYDILQRITSRAGMPPKPVYILQPQRMSTFYNNIDNDLRESMRAIGYAISDVPQGSYVFAYDARSLEQPRSETPSMAPNVELILKIFDSASANSRMLTEEVGRYYIQGAQYLNILPATYSEELMPSRETIQQQQTGFTAQPAPTMTHTSPPVPRAPAYNNSGAQQYIDTYVNSGSAISTPQYQTTISGYEQGRPQLNQAPLMPRARVSKKIDY